MIVLNTERGFVSIESWDDIECLPGYRKDIDPAAVTLSSIIGRYRLSDHITCGLSSCHHKHFCGYVVTTSDGHVTNIGKDCGKTYFGVDFETLSRTFDREAQESARRQSLSAAKNRLDSYQQQITDLMNAERGATWLNKQVKALRQPGNGLPHSICRRIDDMIRSRTAVLKRERRATKEEIEVMRETGRLRDDDHRTEIMVEDDIGLLNAIDVLREENDIRQLLIIDLGETMNRLRDIDVTAATSHELSQLTNRVSEIEPKLDQCRRIVALGRQFFDRENLSQLAEVAETDDEEKQIMAFARRY